MQKQTIKENYEKEDLKIAIMCAYDQIDFETIASELEKRNNNSNYVEKTVFDLNDKSTWTVKQLSIAIRSFQNKDLEKEIKEFYFSAVDGSIDFRSQELEENTALAKKACQYDRKIYDEAMELVNEKLWDREDVDNSVIPFDINKPITWPNYALSSVRMVTPPNETKEEKENS